MEVGVLVLVLMLADTIVVGDDEVSGDVLHEHDVAGKWRQLSRTKILTLGCALDSGTKIQDYGPDHEPKNTFVYQNP